MSRPRRVVITPAEWAIVAIGAGGVIASGAYLLVFHLRDALAWLLAGPVLALAGLR